MHFDWGAYSRQLTIPCDSNAGPVVQIVTVHQIFFSFFHFFIYPNTVQNLRIKYTLDVFWGVFTFGVAERNKFNYRESLYRCVAFELATVMLIITKRTKIYFTIFCVSLIKNKTICEPSNSISYLKCICGLHSSILPKLSSFLQVLCFFSQKRNVTKFRVIRKLFYFLSFVRSAP